MGAPRPGIPERFGSRLTLPAFLGAVLLGGSNFVAVRFSNRELDPLWGAGLRFAAAAALFALLMVAMRLPLPRPKVWPVLGLYGLLAFGVSYGLVYVGMQEVPAGVAAVIMGAVPLLTLLFATAHGIERLSVRAVLGALVVLVGSALTFLQPGEAAFGWPALLAVCLGACSAAESVVVAKRCGPQHPVVMNMVGMTVGGAALLAASAVAAERWALPREPATTAAVAYLVASSVLLFVLVLVVVQRWDASATSYMFVLMPPVAIALGALLGGESVTAATVVGGAVVLCGVYLGAFVPRGSDADEGPASEGQPIPARPVGSDEEGPRGQG